MATQLDPAHRTEEATQGHEIPREEWEALLNAFTDEHYGKTCCLEVLGPEEPRLLVENRPFLSVSLDDEEGDPTIVLTCGDTGGNSPRSLRHMITQPTAIHKSAREGAQAALEIEVSGQGRVVLMVRGA